MSCLYFLSCCSAQCYWIKTVVCVYFSWWCCRCCLFLLLFVLQTLWGLRQLSTGTIKSILSLLQLCAVVPLSLWAGQQVAQWGRTVEAVRICLQTTKNVPEFDSGFNNCPDYECKLKKDLQPSQSFNPVRAFIHSHVHPTWRRSQLHASLRFYSNSLLWTSSRNCPEKNTVRWWRRFVYLTS